MIALLQRVSEAAVHVNGQRVGAIRTGMLALIAVERQDSEREADRLLERMLAYRIFPDSEGRMNLDVRQAGGGLLLVPQFTLAANTRKGNRPSFTAAAEPAEGERLFDLSGSPGSRSVRRTGHRPLRRRYEGKPGE